MQKLKLKTIVYGIITTLLFTLLCSSSNKTKSAMLKKLPNGGEIDGPRSVENIENAMKVLKPRFNYIFKKYQKTKPDIAGTLQLYLDIDSKGNAKYVYIEKSTIKDPLFEEEVLIALSNHNYGEWREGRGKTIVVYPLQFGEANDVKKNEGAEDKINNKLENESNDKAVTEINDEMKDNDNDKVGSEINNEIKSEDNNQVISEVNDEIEINDNNELESKDINKDISEVSDEIEINDDNDLESKDNNKDISEASDESEINDDNDLESENNNQDISEVNDESEKKDTNKIESEDNIEVENEVISEVEN